MRYSVIIPTHNRRDSLLRCLEALARQRLGPNQFEVIVVDDGSTDDSAKAVKDRGFPFALRVCEQANGGASRARNLGAEEAKGEYLVFTEDDVLPDDHWLESAEVHLRKDPSIDVLEGKTVTGPANASVRRYDVPGIPSFIPCNLFVRSLTYRATGGYDPEFFDGQAHLYFREDADLGFRLLDMGARVAIAHDVIVSHPPQFTRLRDVFRHVRRYVFDPLLYRKHPLHYRSLIEVKRIAGLTIHRAHHLVASVYLFDLLWLLYTIVLAPGPEILGQVILAFLCAAFFKFKYQGAGGFRLSRVIDIGAFAIVPLVYLWAQVQGSFRYGTFGSLIP